MSKGERLVFLRKRLGKSQTEAARYLGLSKQTLYKYEKDIITNIPSDVIERIAKYYKTTSFYIVGWIDDPDKDIEEILKEAHARKIAKEETDSTDAMILDLLHNINPEQKDSFVHLLKTLQPEHDQPHLKSKKD